MGRSLVADALTLLVKHWAAPTSVGDMIRRSGTLPITGYHFMEPFCLDRPPEMHLEHCACTALCNG